MAENGGEGGGREGQDGGKETDLNETAVIWVIRIGYMRKHKVIWLKTSTQDWHAFRSYCLGVSLAGIGPKKTAFGSQRQSAFEHPRVLFSVQPGCFSRGTWRIRRLLRPSSQLLPIGSACLWFFISQPALGVTVKSWIASYPRCCCSLHLTTVQLKPLDRCWWLLEMFQSRFLMSCTVGQTHLVSTRLHLTVEIFEMVST